MRVKINVPNDLNVDREEVDKYIAEKLGRKLDKYLQDVNEEIKTANISVKMVQNEIYHISFNMWLPGKKHIFAEEQNRSWQRAVDAMEEQLEKQIKGYIGKMQNNK